MIEKLKEAKSKRDFVAFCKFREKEKLEIFEAILRDAWEKTTTRSGIRFIRSCKSFLKKAGFLTPDQVRALKTIDSRRSSPYPYYLDYSYEEYQEDSEASYFGDWHDSGLEPSDFAGGCP